MKKENTQTILDTHKRQKVYDDNDNNWHKVLIVSRCNIITGKKNRMAADDSYAETYNAFLRRDNCCEVFEETIRRFSRELNLPSVKSCLMIGPGEGRNEVPFIKQCTRNISKVVAVEQDHSSTEGLRVRLDKDLPGVDCQVIESDIQGWKGPDDPVDLVLMMHVLYYLNTSERKELFRKLEEHWLTTGGFAIVVSASSAKRPGNANEIFERMGTLRTAWEDVEAELLEAGFIKTYAHEMQSTRDYSNPDGPLLRFLQSHIDHPVTLDDVRTAIEELFPNGKPAQAFSTIAVFQRA